MEDKMTDEKFEIDDEKNPGGTAQIPNLSTVIEKQNQPTEDIFE